MKKTVAEIINNKIKKGEIEMKSSFTIWMEKLSLKGGITLLLGLLILIAGLLAYWTNSNHDLLFGGYGRYGLSSFIRSFPYIMTGIFMFIFIVIGTLFRKFDFSYKRPFFLILTFIFMGILILGWVLMRQPAGQRFYQQEGRRFQMGNLSNDTMVFGTVSQISGNEIFIYSEDRHLIKISVSPDTHFPFGLPIENNIIRAVGEWEGKTFNAVGVRVFSETNSPFRRMDGSGKGQGNRRMQSN